MNPNPYRDAVFAGLLWLHARVNLLGGFFSSAAERHVHYARAA